MTNRLAGLWKLHNGKPLKQPDGGLSVLDLCCCEGVPCYYCTDILEGSSDYRLTLAGFDQVSCTDTSSWFYDVTETIDFRNVNGSYLYHRPKGSCVASFQSTTATVNGLIACDGEIDLDRAFDGALDSCDPKCGNMGSIANRCGSFWDFITTDCISMPYTITYTPKVGPPPPDVIGDHYFRFAVYRLGIAINCTNNFSWSLDDEDLAPDRPECPTWILSNPAGPILWPNGPSCPKPANNCSTGWCFGQHLTAGATVTLEKI